MTEGFTAALKLPACLGYTVVMCCHLVALWEHNTPTCHFGWKITPFIFSNVRPSPVRGHLGRRLNLDIFFFFRLGRNSIFNRLAYASLWRRRRNTAAMLSAPRRRSRWKLLSVSRATWAQTRAAYDRVVIWWPMTRAFGVTWTKQNDYANK